MILRIYHKWFTFSIVDGRLDSYGFLFLYNKASVNILQPDLYSIWEKIL